MDLSQLKLVAIIRTPKGNKAMVDESSGKGYIIAKGTYIGMNSGTVVKILKDRLIIEEEAENVFGKITIRKRELKLQKPPGAF
jgi:type IV pilus assembly protein PilP